MGSNGPSVRLNATADLPLLRPGIPVAWLHVHTNPIYQAIDFPVSPLVCLWLSPFSNKDFIVCIVVYGCPRETEYYVCLCTIPGSVFLACFALHFSKKPGHNKKQPRPQFGPKNTHTHTYTHKKKQPILAEDFSNLSIACLQLSTSLSFSPFPLPASLT